MAATERSVLERCLGVYFKSVDKLKENIKTLYESYYLLIKDKIECEAGDRLAVNSQSFNRALMDALNRCDELEAQLLGFESWIDLPIVNPADPSSSFDDVSDDAHRLVDILQQVQSALLSAVSKEALRDALPERQSVKALKMEHVPQSQRMQQTLRTHMLSQQYQSQHSEMTELPANAGSVQSTFIQDEQSVPSINDSSSPLGAPNPALSTPQHSFTPQKSQARRIYSDAPSPYNQNQPFSMNRTGSDSNLMGQRPFAQHQEALRGCRLGSYRGDPADRATAELARTDEPEATLMGGTGGGSGVRGPQPYLQPKPCNIRYNPRLYTGGVLPRIKWDDEPVKLPDYEPKDMWAPHRAYFGQNDYIDILGDGRLKSEDFYTGPSWALNAKNEFQRVCRLLYDPAVVAWLEEFEPTRLKDLRKRHKYLFARMNKRINIKFKHYRDAP
ncbi:39S ribosomal protein L51 mitochondrial [Taenia crassiceps]|uniref:Large ribosomal subunit protein mL51 n=1 Tax=Taenia crassiceps TaxID=6207 RepID=A0ABR4QQ75_9CEST